MRNPIHRAHEYLIRCALESLALRYRQVLGWLEDLVDTRIDRDVRPIFVNNTGTLNGNAQATAVLLMSADARLTRATMAARRSLSLLRRIPASTSTEGPGSTQANAATVGSRSGEIDPDASTPAPARPVTATCP